MHFIWELLILIIKSIIIKYKKDLLPFMFFLRNFNKSLKIVYFPRRNINFLMLLFYPPIFLVFKHLPPKNFNFCKNLKVQENNSSKFLRFCFVCSERKCSRIEQELKVERWAQSALCLGI